MKRAIILTCLLLCMIALGFVVRADEKADAAKEASPKANVHSVGESSLVKNNVFRGMASKGTTTLIKLGDNSRVVLRVTYDKSCISQLVPERCLVVGDISEKNLSEYKDGELCYYIFGVENKNGEIEKELIALIDKADMAKDYCDRAVDAAIKNDLSDFRMIWMNRDEVIVYSVNDSPLRIGFDKYSGRSFVVVKSSYTNNKTIRAEFVTPFIISVNNAGAEQQKDRFAYYAGLTEKPLKSFKGYDVNKLPYGGNETALGWYVQWRNPECGDGPFISGLTGISLDNGLPQPVQTPPDCDMSEWDGWTRMERH